MAAYSCQALQSVCLWCPALGCCVGFAPSLLFDFFQLVGQLSEFGAGTSVRMKDYFLLLQYGIQFSINYIAYVQVD